MLLEKRSVNMAPSKTWTGATAGMVVVVMMYLLFVFFPHVESSLSFYSNPPPGAASTPLFSPSPIASSVPSPPIMEAAHITSTAEKFDPECVSHNTELKLPVPLLT